MSIRDWSVAACVVLSYVGAGLLQQVSARHPFDVDGFGQLPVLAHGRIQPFDTVARLGLLQTHGTSSVSAEASPTGPTRAGGGDLTATEWLLELFVKPDDADLRPIFQIRERQLRATLGLAESVRSRSFYSFGDLHPKLAEIGKHALRISKLNGRDRKSWEQECLRLRNALVIYERLKNSFQPNSYLQTESHGARVDYDLQTQLLAYQTDLRTAVEAAVAREHGNPKRIGEDEEQRLRAFARPFLSVQRAAYLSMVPPADRETSPERWENVGSAVVGSARTGRLPQPLTQLATIAAAYAKNTPAVFNRELGSYRHWLEARGLRAEMARARFEYLVNRLQPFPKAACVYLFALAALATSWWTGRRPLHASALVLAVLALAFQTAGLLAEMMIEGRPPVTNAYATILFAGWCGAVIGIATGRRWRSDAALWAAVLIGVSANLLAHSLVPGGLAALARASLDRAFFLAAAVLVLTAWMGGRRFRAQAPENRLSAPRRLAT